MASWAALCSFEPVQVVCPQRREAHVVAARSAVAGWAGGAGHAHFVGGLSDPVAPGRQKSRQCQGVPRQETNSELKHIERKQKALALGFNVLLKSNKTVAAVF